eukprot:5055885-Amphidinium_carterae.2
MPYYADYYDTRVGVMCWGDGSAGQLGYEDRWTQRCAPKTMFRRCSCVDDCWSARRVPILNDIVRGYDVPTWQHIWTGIVLEVWWKKGRCCGKLALCVGCMEDSANRGDDALEMGNSLPFVYLGAATNQVGCSS